jgi:biopolymer transport protein ExbD
MKIHGQRDYLISLESVAMTDIVLNMFIFFFISFSLIYTFSPGRVEKLTVSLPSAAHTAPVEGRAKAEITMTNEGRMYLDGNSVTPSQLREGIQAQHKLNPQLMVAVRADKGVQFQRFVSVLDVLVEVGVKNLDIAAERHSADEL